MMSMEEKTQVKVAVEIGLLWRALSKDLRDVIPKCMPNLVDEVQLLEGDGGLGSILLFKFGQNLPQMSYQREKIVELNESEHRIALQVIEGGYLSRGFSSYSTTFQLTALTETETLIDVKVTYDVDKTHKFDAEQTHKPGQTTSGTRTYIKSLEDYLSNMVS